MTDELRFEDLTPLEFPVFIGGLKYTLREASEATAAHYRNEQTRCFKMSSGEMSGITGPIANTQALLVSQCLFDETNQRVAIDVIRTWPARVVKPIFEKAQEMSGLKEDDDETNDNAAKNLPSDTMDGSD